MNSTSVKLFFFFVEDNKGPVLELLAVISDQLTQFAESHSEDSLLRDGYI